MTVSKQQIQKAKLFPMASILEYFGFMPCEQKGSELIYFSPFRNEKTPSFRVNIKGNVCKDFGDNENSGDIIRLYQKLTKCTFLQAVHDLSNNKINTAQSNSFVHYEPIITKEKKQAEIVEIKNEITNKNLIHYLESRCISIETANKYCNEIHYKQPNGKIYYSIGFKNNSGGYELRNANFKSCVGKKDITTIYNSDIISKTMVFEGFFDFLSFIELETKKGKFNKYIITNSNTLIRKVDLEDSFWVHTYFDNDISGKKATEKIKSKCHKLTTFKDWSFLYKTDLNDYLIEKKSK